MKNVVLLTRVSKQSQDYERQVRDLTAHADKQGYNVVAVLNEKISGAVKNTERKTIQELYRLIASTPVDMVLCTEISRAGRNTLEVLKLVEELHTAGVCLYVKNMNMYTLNEDGTPNSVASMMITMLAELAKLERTWTHERLESGKAKYIADGGKLGRKVGYVQPLETTKAKHSDVIKLLNKKRTIREISTLTGKSTRTIQKVKKLLTIKLAA
tara:strand:- start:36 stop:674 length:639 start_codon:yes stop_codon:yes gene_type:complete